MTVLSELRMQPAARTTRKEWDAAIRPRLILTLAVMSTLLIGANLATPLYPLLGASLGLSYFGVTLAFASYVLVLVAGLLLVGHWSDYIGRRAALVVAGVVSLAGGLIFGTATDVGALMIGRALQGASVALATGASSAALRELLPHRPEWATRFTLLVSAGGVAAGPVIGGLLSLLPAPTLTPFLIHSAVLAGLLVPLCLLKARPAISLAEGRPLAMLRPRKPAVSHRARTQFWVASATGFLSFAAFGFCLSLAPSYFSDIAGTTWRPAIGLLAALALGASAVSQLTGIRGRYTAPAGLALMGTGIALIPVAGATGSLALLVAACLLAGFGQGMAFRVVFNEVAAAVEASEHARIISTVYVITYLGSALPVLGLGAAGALWGLGPSVAWFSGLITAACLFLAVLSLVRARRRSISA
ncbi:MFS transporter [Arthrobacter sp. zg-Y411]|uniref:MFS transporter n=1 Tax=Arthrobacter zhangbolii TaxID=2886936 RepID=UPI001D13AF23|nr:MFS transporter [Arthrobacter zhangbolii]MCC3294947.1 MFS transporter [Arthrobacter zhangbolii]